MDINFKLRGRRGEDAIHTSYHVGFDLSHESARNYEVIYVVDRGLLNRRDGAPLLCAASLLSSSGVLIDGAFFPLITGIEERRLSCPILTNSDISCVLSYPDFPFGALNILMTFESGRPTEFRLIEAGQVNADARFEMSYVALNEQRAGVIDGIEILRGGKTEGNLEAVMCAGGILNTKEWLESQQITEEAKLAISALIKAMADGGHAGLIPSLRSAIRLAEIGPFNE